MAKKTRQEIVDELDELGIVGWNENDKYSDLVKLLNSKKIELGLVDYKQGDNAISKKVTADLPTEPKIQKSSSLPKGFIEIEVMPEEVAQLQKEKKLVGYREIDNGMKSPKREILKRIAIVKEKG